MPSNMVDAVRNIPIIIERNMPQPMAVDDETGFPFDKDIDRDASFRTQLDDIAKRHPELAGHFEGFPFRTNSLGRRVPHPQYQQHPQQQRQPPPDEEDDDGFPRFTARDRPFGSRFEQFGFPFTSRDGSSFANTAPDQGDGQSPPQYHHRQPPQQQQQATPHATPTAQAPPPGPPPHHQHQQVPGGVASADEADSGSSQGAERPPQAPERGRRPQHLQPSNTADLTYKQEEPAVNERSQRSMSAPPPESRSQQPRYVSSINIPIQRGGAGAGAGGDAPPQSPPHGAAPQQQGFRPTERVIPIHVEGRDEPVMPKNIHQTYAQQAPPQTHPAASAGGGGYTHPHVEPEHIFGGRNMGDFMGHAGRFPTREDVFGRQYQMPPDPQRFQQQPKQQTPPRAAPPAAHPAPPHPQHQQQAPPSQQQQQQHNAEAQHQDQEQQQQQKPTPIDQIKAIQKDVSELMGQVDQFAGAPRDKQYLYLDEMLTRNLIKLDNIDTQGQENIRSARREAIKCIERCIGILESKANANVAAKEQTTMEVDQKPEEEAAAVQAEKNDAKSDGGNEAKSEGQEQTMESEVSSTSNGAQQGAGQVEGVEAMEVAAVPAAEAQGNAEGAKESSEASAKGDSTAPEGGKLEDGAVKPNVESSEAVATMEVETAAKAATEGGDAASTEEGKDQAQPDSSSQAKEESKDENKKEKKKGKKKEKSEKK